MKRIALLFLFFLGFIFLSQKTSSLLISTRTSFEVPYPVSDSLRSVLVPWINFDGRNYLDIVLSGYHLKGDMQLSVFFPLYPLLIRLFSFNLFMNPLYVGLLISYIFIFLSLLLLYRLTSSFKTLVVLLLFPTSFFYLAYYTESLFLFLSLSFFLALSGRRYWIAAMLCALATATKITGIALIPSLAWELFQHFRRTKRFPFPILVSPLGLLAYLFFTQIHLRNWALVFTGQSFWNRKFSLLNPITSFWEWLTKVLAGPQAFYDSPFVYPSIVIEFFTVVGLIYLGIAMYKKIALSYYLYFVTSLLLILFAGNFSSVHRYAAIMFPVFIYLSGSLKRPSYQVYIAVSLCLLWFMSSLFTHGYWAG